MASPGDGEDDKPPDHEGPKKIDPTREGENPPESGEQKDDEVESLLTPITPEFTKGDIEDPENTSPTNFGIAPREPDGSTPFTKILPAPTPANLGGPQDEESKELSESSDETDADDWENRNVFVPLRGPLPISDGPLPPWTNARSYSDRGRGAKNPSAESEDSEIDWEDVKRSEKQWEALGAAEVLAHRRRHKREELHITVVVGELKKLPQQSAAQQSEDSGFLTGCFLSFSSLVLVSSILLCLGTGTTTFAVAVGFGSRALYEDPKMRERFFEDVSTLIDHVTPQQTPESIPDAGKPNHQKQVGSP